MGERDGIDTAMGEREMGEIQRWVRERDGIDTAMGERELG